jgi:hypothetical protein
MFLISYYAINPNGELDDFIVDTVDSICRRYLTLTASKGNGSIEEIPDAFTRIRVLEVIVSKPLTDTELQIVWPIILTELGFETVYTVGEHKEEPKPTNWIGLLN